MSAISTILTRLANTVALIRSAIYAIDVRDDIADAIEKCGEAIEQCYSDVSNPTLQTEALEAALQEKIDQGEMAALTIGDRTITAVKLANGVIPAADATLTTSGGYADAAETGRQIGNIKADLGGLTLLSGSESEPIDCDTVSEPKKYIIYDSSFVTNTPPQSNNKGAVLTVLKENGATGQTVYQEYAVPSTGEKFNRFMFFNANNNTYSAGKWNPVSQFEYSAIDVLLEMCEKSAYADTALVEKITNLAKTLPRNIFNPLTAPKVRGFVRTTTIEAVIYSTEENGYNTFIKVRPNAKYRVGKFVTNSFRVSFLAMRPTPPSSGRSTTYTVLKTEADHDKCVLRTTAPENAVYMLIQYATGSDTEAYEPEEAFNSISVIEI